MFTDNEELHDKEYGAKKMKDDDGLSWKDVSPITLLSLIAILLLMAMIVYQVITQSKGWIFWVVLDAVIIIVNVYASIRLIFTNHMIRIRRTKISEQMKELEKTIKGGKK